MEKHVETRKKIVKVVFVLAVIAALMLSAHLLVNYFNISDVMQSIHGG
jgi:hypothetical protein